MIDMAGLLKQLRAERDLIEYAIERVTSLADTRKRDLGRPRASRRALDERTASRTHKSGRSPRRVGPLI